MKYSAAAVFAVLCVSGLAVMGNGGRLEELQSAAGKFLENLTRQQLPDSVEVSGGSVQVGTIVAEDKLNDAILKENGEAPSISGTGADQPGSGSDSQSGQGSAGQSGQGSPDSDSQSGQGSAGQPGPGSAGQSGQGSAGQSGQGSSSSDGQSGQDSAGQSGQGSAGQSASGSDGQSAQGSASQSTPEPAGKATPEPVQPTESPAQPVSYTVKRGDTLIGICIERYGSDARVSEVCSLNQITNPDNIKIGQKILLP